MVMLASCQPGSVFSQSWLSNVPWMALKDFVQAANLQLPSSVCLVVNMTILNLKLKKKKKKMTPDQIWPEIQEFSPAQEKLNIWVS